MAHAPHLTKKDVAAIGLLVEHHGDDGDALGEAAKRLYVALDQQYPKWRTWTERARHGEL